MWSSPADADYVTLVLGSGGSGPAAEFLCPRQFLHDSESEYLRQLVSAAWAEGQRSRIEIKYDCTPDNFESILRFAFGHRRKAKVYDHLPSRTAQANPVEAGDADADADTVSAAGSSDPAHADAVDAAIFARPAGRSVWAELAHEEDEKPRAATTPTPPTAGSGRQGADEADGDGDDHLEPFPLGDDDDGHKEVEDDAWVEELISRENAVSLYGDALFFQLPELAAACEAFVARHVVGYHNACQYWIVSAQAGLHSLEHHCRAIFQDHFSKIVRHDDFLQLPKELLLQAVRSPCLKAESEEQVWDAVLRWGRHQCADDAADDDGYDDGESEEADATVDKKSDKGKEKVDVAKRNEKEKKKEKTTTKAGQAGARWERGVSVGDESGAEEAARRERAERESDENEQRISHALKTRLLPEFIPFIRYPLMNYAFLCERVAPSGLVPPELLDEAYQFLLYQANGLTGAFKGTDNGKRPPSFRVHARTPKVRMPEVHTATARGGSVRSANQEIVAEVFRWLFDARPPHASLAALQHSVEHLLSAKPVGRMFPWITAELVISYLESIGFVTPSEPTVAAAAAANPQPRRGVQPKQKKPRRAVVYNIQRDDEPPQVSHTSRAFSVIVEDILLWLRDHPSRPGHMDALVRQVKYYLGHKKVKNVFMTDAQKIVHLLVHDRVVMQRRSRDAADEAERPRRGGGRYQQYAQEQQGQVVLNACRDTALACAACGQAFVFNAQKSQEFYRRKLHVPTRCPACPKPRPSPSQLVAQSQRSRPAPPRQGRRGDFLRGRYHQETLIDRFINNIY